MLHVTLKEFTTEWLGLMCVIMTDNKASELEKIVANYPPHTDIFVYDDSSDSEITKWANDSLDEEDYKVIGYCGTLPTNQYSTSLENKNLFILINSVLFIKNPQAALQFKLRWV